MKNGREIAKLEREIDLVDWLQMMTPDPNAQAQYHQRINQLQYIHHRLAGRWYHQPKPIPRYAEDNQK